MLTHVYVCVYVCVYVKYRTNIGVYTGYIVSEKEWEARPHTFLTCLEYRITGPGGYKVCVIGIKCIIHPHLWFSALHIRV